MYETMKPPECGDHGSVPPPRGIYFIFDKKKVISVLVTDGPSQSKANIFSQHVPLTSSLPKPLLSGAGSFFQALLAGSLGPGTGLGRKPGTLSTEDSPGLAVMPWALGQVASVTFLHTGEEGKAKGLPWGLHAGPESSPIQALLFLPGLLYSGCLSSALGVLSKCSQMWFLLPKSLSGGKSTLFKLSRVSKVKAGLGRSQGQSLGCV